MRPSRLWHIALLTALVVTAVPAPSLAAPSLVAEATSLLTNLGGSTAMVAVVPGEAPLVSLNPDTPLYSASLYKLGVMAATYAAIARGDVSLDQPVTITQEELDFYGYQPATPAGATLTAAEALRRMITVSDNSTAGALLKLVGYPAVDAAFVANGMPHSRMGSPPSAPASSPRTLARTTAGDQAAFFGLLLAGRVVSRSASEAMIGLLKGQTDNNRLPALLPRGTPVAHKTGELDDVRNDSGIIFTPRGPVICAVITNDQLDLAAAVGAIAQEGRLVYDAVMAGGPPLADFSVGDGWFYTQANGRGGAQGDGFTITDAGGTALWSAFQARGGVASIGYPASHAFTWRGFTYQITQKEVLQWRPDAGTVAYMNIFDVLHDAGFDGWLDRTHQIPPPVDTAADSTLAWGQVIARHLRMLDGSAPLKARYFSDPTYLDDYGLPMSLKDYGPMVVVRCQRAAFQYWKVVMPFASAGSVTLVNGGDIGKAAGIFPASAVTPGPPTS